MDSVFSEFSPKRSGEPMLTVPAFDWWPLEPGVVDRCIVVSDRFRRLTEPDEERLSCGHSQPVRTWGRDCRKYYNRRRRCEQCGIDRLESVSLDLSRL